MESIGFRCGEKYDITSHTGKYCACLLAMPLFPGALNDAAGKFSESDVFSAIDPDELKAFDASFPVRQEVLIRLLSISECEYFVFKIYNFLKNR